MGNILSHKSPGKEYIPKISFPSVCIMKDHYMKVYEKKITGTSILIKLDSPFPEDQGVMSVLIIHLMLELHI